MPKTILITGASSGIGKTTAQHFHEEGWNVVATMRSPDQETELTALDNVLVTRLDVLDSASITSAIAAGIERFGGIDVLVNNAGIAVYGPLEATPVEQLRRQFDVNVIGLLETTKAILPHFRAKRDGIIINISSISGKMTFPLGTSYHGSKFAVEGLSESLHFELEPIGVKVKIVEPGMTKTPFGQRSVELSNDESLEEYQSLIAKVFGLFESMLPHSSEPRVVSSVIFRAATDGTTQLRYTSGDDAEEILANRKAADDATFLAGVKAQFGL
ncbi:MAG: SDR family oxidoreductase [Myxococcota bacterium]